MIVGLLAAVGLPATAVGFAFCQFAFEQWAQSLSSFFVAHDAMTNALMSGTLLVGLLSKAIRGDLNLRAYPAVGWMIMGLFAYALGSVFWSVSIPDSLGAVRGEAPYVITFLGLSPLLVSSSRDVNRMLMAMFVLGSMTTCLLLGTSEFKGREVVLQGAIYLRGTEYAGSNPLATASLGCWVCLIGMLLNFRGVARFWQVVRWGVVAAGLVLTIRSGSRGQLIGLMLTSVVFLPVSRRIRSVAGFVGTVMGIAVLMGCAYWAYDHFADTTRWNVEGMVDAYQGSRMEYVRFLIGYWAGAGPVRWLIGLGNSASFAPFLLSGYPHFVPGEVLAEEGMAGFALYVVILIMGFRCLVSSYRLVWTDPVARGRLAALGALCLFEFILSLKQGSLIGNPMFFGFLVMIGRHELALRHEAEMGEEWVPDRLLNEYGDPSAPLMA